MSFQPEEMIVNVDDLSWTPMGDDSRGKVLRACPETGAWTVMFKQAGRMGRSSA